MLQLLFYLLILIFVLSTIEYIYNMQHKSQVYYEVQFCLVIIYVIVRCIIILTARPTFFFIIYIYIVYIYIVHSGLHTTLLSY